MSSGALPSFDAGVALVAGTAADWLELAGADRVRFLHNLCTSDVRVLAPGGSQRSFLTSAQGRVLADADVIALADRLLLRLPAGRGGALAEHLLRYRVAEQVEVTQRPNLAAAELRGARAGELLRALDVEAPDAPGAHREAALAGTTVRLRAVLRARVPRFELLAAVASLPPVVAALRAQGAALDLVEPSPAALEAARIEGGELRWGVDYGADCFPQETGEPAAISTTKGCYLGQEVVARIHFRGQVQRLARGLVFAPRGAPAPGVELRHAGRPAGRATSVAHSAALGVPVGLALVQRRAAAPGTRLEVAGGGAAEVRELPLI
jgi:folate-binding protein YgfZ